MQFASSHVYNSPWGNPKLQIDNTKKEIQCKDVLNEKKGRETTKKVMSFAIIGDVVHSRPTVAFFDIFILEEVGFS